MSDLDANGGVMENDGAAVAETESAKRSQILAGARRAFLANGYEGTSMSLIAREASSIDRSLIHAFAVVLANDLSMRRTCHGRKGWG